ncbi:(d)CMP kinase [Corynebacterium freiburgense]|uniref:(d)CMP kinase n=1 Tax=Corynebacterium freiburgense TaxID=556548 RepID=UPI00047E39F5|nr:(d)CMP kinase [Corynebacterium freiburgense]
MPNGGLIIAVDGPSGTGKSTVCRAVAQQLHAQYLDTGAMYRVATLHILRKGIDPADTPAVIDATTEIPFEIHHDPSATSVLLDGLDVSDEIRGSEVTAHVSAVSAIPEVRKNLVALQRNLAFKAGRCVVEGRDIGTVVFPEAPLKIYMTASAEVRADRRYRQDTAAGRDVDYLTILREIERRDDLDSSRAASPLRPADDAIHLDTSELSLQEVINTVIELAATSAERNSQQ